MLLDLDPNKASAELGESSIGRHLLAMNEEAKFAQAAMKTFGRGNKALNGEYSKANNAKPPGKYGVVWKRPAKVKPIYEKRPVYETRKRIVKEKYMDEIEEEYETNEVDHNRPIFKDSSTIQKGKLKKNKEYAWKAGFGYGEIANANQNTVNGTSDT